MLGTPTKAGFCSSAGIATSGLGRGTKEPQTGFIGALVQKYNIEAPSSVLVRVERP